MLKNEFLKIVSLCLASVMLVGSVPQNILATSEDTTALQQTIHKDNKLKNFYKQHPKLSKLGIAAGAIGGLAGIGKVGSLIHRERYIKDVKTNIDNYSASEIKGLLKYEINYFINFAPDVFEVEQKLIDESDPRALLLTLMKLNDLFDKYSGFRDQFIAYKRSKQKKFSLTSFNFKDDRLASLIYEQITEPDISAIRLGNLKHFKKSLFRAKCAVDTHQWSPRSESNLLDSVVTHEFGHLMFIFELIRSNKFQPIKNSRELNAYIKTLPRENRDNTVKSSLADFVNLLICSQEVTDSFVSSYETEGQDESPILKKIQKKDIDVSGVHTYYSSMYRISPFEMFTSLFSAYGATTPQEAFAEIFAHLECTDNSDDIDEMAHKLEAWLVTVGFLPAQNSKFNKDFVPEQLINWDLLEHDWD